ncbi:MAG: glutamine--fructose-6-phosphate transaminase (isomerizing) [Ignavibacteria bacterium]|jgi:glucosamine--fructose-6-phosphate aminotransferase (isomerizing)|nr:glutamine--fructose-6-phosphate transaminase (isomerizing) [Ignavibacteria bacterium]
MCGIIGYIGKRKATEVIMNGLKRVEYRGYDSAGISIIENGKLVTIKKSGRLNELNKLIDHNKYSSNIGFGHTRWATHGEPNDINAHPHLDNSGKVSIIHNGIIENYSALKSLLTKQGYHFKTETDTEVLAVYIGSIYEKNKNIAEAVRLALADVTGTFGLLVIAEDEPDKIIGARRGSPLVIGIGKNEFILASDQTAIVDYTKHVIYPDDNEMVILTKDSYVIKNLDNININKEITTIEFELNQLEKGGFPHFMLKEIFEQGKTIENATRGRIILATGDVRLGGLTEVADRLRTAKRIILTACGTSWHSALIGKYMIETLARIPVDVEYASEFRYRDPVIYPEDFVVAISQSGETADTLEAIREAKRKGCTTLGIVNVVGSSIARATDAGVYLHAGPEIGVASTKAFTSQVTVLLLFALYIGRMRSVSQTEGIRIIKEIQEIPKKIEKILQQADKIKEIAKRYSKSRNFLYLGRGYNYPIALEGALKLKEISYVHAEGYPAAEMKHGPLALIDDEMPVVFLATKDEVFDKLRSNLEEVKARGGKIIAIATENNEGNELIKNKVEHMIYIPETLPIVMPILSIIPLQLLAYYIADELGRDIDNPRHLAKSVTVE